MFCCSLRFGAALLLLNRLWVVNMRVNHIFWFSVKPQVQACVSTATESSPMISISTADGAQSKPAVSNQHLYTSHLTSLQRWLLRLCHSESCDPLSFIKPSALSQRSPIRATCCFNTHLHALNTCTAALLGYPERTAPSSDFIERCAGKAKQ